METGPPSRVGELKLYFSGAVAHDPAVQSLLQQQWALPVGTPFRQRDWNRAKAQALRTLTRGPYPFARLRNSLADVDAEQQRVALAVELDSGAAVVFGELQIEGASRHPAAVIKSLVAREGLTPGAPYHADTLARAQQRLLNSGWYESVFVGLAPEHPLPAADGGATELPPPAPAAAGQPARGPSPAIVVVQVREAPRQRLGVGVGVSSDSGLHLSGEHRHASLPGVGGELFSAGRYEVLERSWNERWRSVPDARGWRWVGEWQWRRLDSAALRILGQTLRVGEAQAESAAQSTARQWYGQWTRDRSTEGATTEAQGSALSVGYGWSRRQLDQLPFAQAGDAAALEAAAGVAYGAEARDEPGVRAGVANAGRTATGYGRLRARALQYQPPGEAGRLLWRGELGAILSPHTERVPASERFLLGGDGSVRGYAPRAIGVATAEGGISPGAYALDFSLEWERPMRWRQDSGEAAPRAPSNWEQVVFVDSGAVSNSLRERALRVGVGAGVRYLSPLGPLQADLAYGVATRRVRLHLRVGFSF